MRRSLALRLRKPAYLYRPSQVLRRFSNTRQGGEARVLVPWGDHLSVDTREMVGSSIARLGVWELAVTEAIYRLVRPGDTVADLGANLGYDTSLFAYCVGRAGTVHAFEPHPGIHERLARNVATLQSLATIRVHQAAVSDREGKAFLAEPTFFARNMGGASLAAEGIPVTVTTLDATLPDTPVGMVKIDIEGQELAALRGGVRTIAQTRNVIFEEYAPLPTPVTTMLLREGFAIYGIDETLRGPRLIDPALLQATPRWEAPTFLATREEGITERVRPDGWRCLHPSRRGRTGAGDIGLRRRDRPTGRRQTR